MPIKYKLQNTVHEIEDKADREAVTGYLTDLNTEKKTIWLKQLMR